MQNYTNFGETSLENIIHGDKTSVLFVYGFTRCEPKSL